MSDAKKSDPSTVVQALAKQAGVSFDDTLKVLNELGLDRMVDNLNAVSPDAVQNLQAGNLKISAKLARSAIVA